jgi:hypothetical protein
VPEAATPTPSDVSQRAPITDDECRTLAAAMLHPSVNGNLAAAARLLGIDPNRAAKIAAKDVYLRAVNPSVDPTKLLPAEEDTLHRPPTMPPAPVESRVAGAMAKQEKLLEAQDWKALGLTDEDGAELVSMERFAMRPLIHSIRTTHGGMMFAYARLLKLVKKYSDEILEGHLPKEEIQIGDEFVPRDQGDVERDWLYAVISASAELRNINTQISKGQLVLLKAEQLRKAMNGKGGKKGKPGFGMLVKAEPGSSVHLYPERKS